MASCSYHRDFGTAAQASCLTLDTPADVRVVRPYEDHVFAPHDAEDGGRGGARDAAAGQVVAHDLGSGSAPFRRQGHTEDLPRGRTRATAGRTRRRRRRRDASVSSASTHVISGGGTDSVGREPAARDMMDRLKANGLTLANLMIVGFTNAIYNRPGKDEDIEKVIQSIRAAGQRRPAGRRIQLVRASRDGRLLRGDRPRRRRLDRLRLRSA